MKLSAIVEGYLENLPAGLVVSEATIARNLKKAVRLYCGYAALTSFPLGDGVIHTPVDASDSIDGAQDFDLTPSEYAVIRPMFELYVEHENATHLEASRGLGVDVYGRTVSEVAQDIAQRELDFPKQAFYQDVFSI